MFDITELDFKTLTRTRKVNGERTISLDILPTERNESYFDSIIEETEIDFDDDTYIIKKLNERSIGKTYHKQIEAVHNFYVNLINKQQPLIHNGSITFNNYMNLVFDGTGYTFIVTDQFNARPFENLGNDNRLSLLQKGLERFEAEFELVGTQVMFKTQVGNDTDFQFRFGHNVKAISKDVDTTNLATVIRGTGDPELGITAYHRSDNADIFGEIDAPPYSNENFKSEETLLTELKSRLQDTPEFSLTIDFVDLRAAGYPFTVPNEGDRVFVIYEPMDDLLIETRILEIQETFDANLNPIKTTVTLANYKKTFAGTMFNTVKKQLSEIVNDDGIVRYNALDEAVKRATEILVNDNANFIYDSSYILGVNTDDPNKLIRVTSQGIGISQDGGNSFPNAMTADGFVADYMTVGTLRGIDIIGTNIMSFNPVTNNVITLENGEIETFTAGKKRFGVYGDGLVAYHWETEEMVARLRPTHINNERYGAGIIGFGDYFSIGSGVVGGVEDPYMMFDFGADKSLSVDVDVFQISASSMNAFVDDFYVRGDVSVDGCVFTNAVEMISGTYLYLKTASEVRVTQFGTTDQYRDVRARSFPTSTSQRKNKSEISIYKNDVLATIKNLNTYLYKIKGEESEEHKQLGLMIDETPIELHGRKGDSMELYALATFAIEGVKQLLVRVEKLEGVKS